MSFRRAGLVTLRTFQFICALSVLKEYVIELRISHGPSMLPTFDASPNLVLSECISHRMSPPRLDRGDLVTFLKPTQSNISVCKRIIGLPGDTICVDPQGLTPSEHIIVPQGHVWVQGDNAPHSLDSRAYGPIPMGLIKSKVFARLYPRPAILWNPVTCTNLKS